MNLDEALISLRRYFSIPHFFGILLIVIFYSTLIACLLTWAGINTSFAVNFSMSQSYGISIYVLIFILLWIFKPGYKTAPIAVICIVGSIGGYFCGTIIGSFILDRFLHTGVKYLFFSIKSAIILIVGSGIACYLLYSIARYKVSAALIQGEKIKRLASEKEVLEANLRLLQAQIEPHFLFNTLSNVMSLIDTDPAKGKSMLSDLTHYLRTSLSRTLPDVTTLAQEMEMVQSYLDIQKVRMGERLTYSFNLPDSLKRFPFPPMLLQPLVENAVKHGLEPRAEGGMISITTVESADTVRIEVRDTGNGLSSIEQTGVGIANVRNRIGLLFGDKGLLSVEENVPHGVCTIIEVPKNGL